MELDRYVDALNSQLMEAAEAGGDDARVLARRLAAPLESSVRLMLLEVLSDAANEITLELAPGSVDVRVRGRDPELVVTPPPAAPHLPPPAPDDVMRTSSDSDDGGTARITLRLPESLKQRVEDSASRQTTSVNSWLVRAINAAVDAPGESDQGRHGPPSVSSRFTGWVQ